MKKNNSSAYIADLIGSNSVVPVLTVEEVNHARPLAEALISGGISILEVTLRTPAALNVIHEMSTVRGSVVAAGTIANKDDLKSARDAGAQFGITPGITHSILEAAYVEDFPLLPGVSTVSELMTAVEYGYDFLKFFPAESAGGTAKLKSFAGPFPEVTFCPTGGITINNAEDYLALKNVRCVGGTWLAPAHAVKSRQWEKISRLASEALHSLNQAA